MFKKRSRSPPGTGGVIGSGFSFSGLSGINRCGSTFTTDGVARTVTFDEYDNFCLNGVRLLTVEGTKGRSGSVYRSEFDDFNKVTLHGDAMDSDSYFTVQTKSGDFITYGFQHLNQSWLMTRITDTTGKNPVIYSYNENAQIDNIQYDIFDINFVYSAYMRLNGNVDTFHYKFDDQIFSDNKLLSKIEIKTAGSLSNYYEVERRGPKQGDQSSRTAEIITGIKYCDSNSNCLPKTQFEWAAQPILSEQYNYLNKSIKSTSVAGLSANVTVPTQFWLDLDGNQELDLCSAYVYGESITGFKCFYNLIQDQRTEVNYTLGNYWLIKDNFWWTDINNDGKNNLCRAGETGMLCSGLNLDGSFDDVVLPMNNWGQEKYRWWLDFDGDGRNDFCRRDGSDLLCSLNKDGKSWKEDVVIKELDWASIENTVWTDIDGNGYPDLCSNRDNGFICTRFNAGEVIGTQNQLFSVSDMGDSERRWWIDINGDGASDFCRATGSASGYDSNLVCSLGSSGEVSSFADDLVLKGGVDWSGEWGSSDKRWWLDLNQDGLLDFCRAINGVMRCTSMYGENYELGIDNWGDKYRWWIDFDNDGKVDLCRNTGETLKCDSNKDITSDPLSLVKVTNGLGHTSSVKFGPYSEHGSPETNLDYPFVATRGSMPVAYQLDTDNGDGQTSFVFNYGPAKQHFLGQGSSGFTWIKQREFINGENIRSRETTFNADFPFNQTPKSIKEYFSDGSALSSCETCSQAVSWDFTGLTLLNEAETKYGQRVTKFQSQAVIYERSKIVQKFIAQSELFEQFSYNGNTYLKKPDIFVPIAGSVMVPIILPATEYYLLDDKTVIQGAGDDAIYITQKSKLSAAQIQLLQDKPVITGDSISVIDNTIYQDTITNNYHNVELQNYAIYETEKVEKSYTLTGNLLATVKTETSEVDNYGNTGKIKITTTATNPASNKSENFIKITENKYDADDPSRWLLGRLTETKATHINQSGEQQVKHARFQYDPITGLLVAEISEPGDPLQVVKESIRNAEGLVSTSKITALHGSTRQTRTSSTLVTYSGTKATNQSTNPLGFTSSQTIDRKNNVSITTDINGLESRSYYDGFGRIKEVWTPGKAGFNKTKTEYYPATDSQCKNKPDNRTAYCVVTVAANGSESIAYFDMLQREIRKTAKGLNNRWIFSDTYFNAKNQIIKTSRPYYQGDAPQYSITEYDLLGRLSSVSEPGPAGKNPNWAEYQYGALWVKATDALGREKTTYTNAMGWVVEIAQPKGAKIKNTYSPSGQLLTAAGANGKVITNQYDVMGNKKHTQDPDLGGWSYYYDGFGQLISQTDAKGQTKTMSYDVLGRMVSRSDENIEGESTTTALTTWYYDQLAGFGQWKGALLKVEQPGKLIKQLYYTSLGQVEKEVQITSEHTFSRQFEYNQYGQVTSDSRPNQFTLNFDYDPTSAINTGVWGDVSQLQLDFTQEEYNKVIKPLLVEALAKASDYLGKAKELNSQQHVYAQRRDEYDALRDEIIDVDTADNIVASISAELSGRELTVYEDSIGEQYYKVPDRFILISGSVDIPIVQKANYHLKLEGNTVRKVSFAEWEELESELTLTNQVAYYGDFTDNGSGGLATITIERDDPLYDQRLRNYFSRLNTLAADIQRLEYVEEHSHQLASTYADAAKQLITLVKQTQLVAARYRNLSESSQDEHDQLDGLNDESGQGKIYYWKLATLDAEGRIFSELYGNGLVNNYDYNEGTGQLQNIKTMRGQKTIRNLHYVYDRMDNVRKREDLVNYITENYEYDDLDRLTDNVLIGTFGKHEDNPLFNKVYSVAYNKAGNITSKTGVGSYEYKDQNHAHAVTKAGNRQYSYDANGNMLSGDGRQITWSSFNKPIRIEQGNNWVSFAYGPDRSRYLKVNQNGDKTWYLGKAYELVERPNGEIEHKQFVSAGGKLVAINIDRKKSNDEGLTASFDRQIRYIHGDALGSTDLVTDIWGNVVDRKNYDAWGKERNFEWEKETNHIDQILMTNRGYTGHEQVEEIDLVHMNGRMYDSTLGRFISADTFIQAPDNSQSYNRYSYVLNNPMKYSDPSGHFFKKLFKKIKKFVSKYGKAILQIVVTAVATWICPPLGIAIAGMYGYQQGGIQGAFTAMFSAVLFMGVGSAFSGMESAFGNGVWAAKTVAHGIAGGVSSVMRGGKFGDGFLSAAFTQAIAPGMKNMDSGNTGVSIQRTLAAAVAGGTASKLTGGKFENGAITGAFSRLFNHELHGGKKPTSFGGNMKKGWNNFTNFIGAGTAYKTLSEMTFITSLERNILFATAALVAAPAYGLLSLGISFTNSSINFFTSGDVDEFISPSISSVTLFGIRTFPILGPFLQTAENFNSINGLVSPVPIDNKD
ncbi:MAG: RHS repeat-associated protein [Moritella dasanensis]